MPGIVNVVTAKDVKGTNRLVAPQGTVHSLCDGLDRPVICDGVVRRYGDVVAVVAATGRDKARAAAERVRVEYEPLPAVMTFMEAAAEGAFPIHENTPNIYMEQPVYKGEDTQGLLEHAAHTVAGSFGTSRQPHLTVEPDVVLAYPEDGGVVILCKGQYLYGNIAQMAPAIGLPKEKVRILGNPAGGSFGYSMSPGNTALAAACALALDAPVSLVLSYAEHQHTTGKRSPVYANVRLACDRRGKADGNGFPRRDRSRRIQRNGGGADDEGLPLFRLPVCHPEHPWSGADGLHQQQFRDGFPGVRLAADLHGRASRSWICSPGGSAWTPSSSAISTSPGKGIPAPRPSLTGNIPCGR